MRLLLLLLVPLAAEGSVLRAVRSVLSYYSRHQVTDDFIFGVLLTMGQLNVIKLFNDEMEDEIEALLETCDTIIQNNPHMYVTKNTVERVGESLSLLKMSELRLERTPKLPTYRLESNLRHGSPSMFNSTNCILEALMASGVSNMCLMQMSDNEARGYTLAHQALYFSIASSMLQPPFVHEKIEEKCGKILSEVNYAWMKRMPVYLRDLAIEEVAVCGLNKYPEFLTKPMLDFILSLQRKEGCFSVAREGPLNRCDEHLSAVSMLALTNFLFVKEETEYI